jgi:hypothetical protein
MLTHVAPRRIVTVLFVVAFVLTIGKITWSNCPECYGDQQPMVTELLPMVQDDE